MTPHFADDGYPCMMSPLGGRYHIAGPQDRRLWGSFSVFELLLCLTKTGNNRWVELRSPTVEILSWSFPHLFSHEHRVDPHTVEL